MATIEIKSLSKNYGDIEALKDINLAFETNGCVGILGPNGAGKTTLMKLMTNIIKPTSGRVVINGVNVSEKPSMALLTVGSIIEQPEFYTYLTAFETLMFVCRIKGGEKDYCKSEIERISAITELKGFINRKTGTFSRGMKQRLALSVALINNPDVIILDEPTFGLDPRGMADIRNTLIRIRNERKSIIVLSTHLISEAKELCDRVIIMDQGSVVYDSIMDENEKVVRIRFYETSTEKLKGIDHEIVMEDDGKTAMVKIGKDVRNDALIKEMIDLGLKIKDVDESSGIEEKYLTIVKSTGN